MKTVKGHYDNNVIESEEGIQYTVYPYSTDVDKIKNQYGYFLIRPCENEGEEKNNYILMNFVLIEKEEEKGH